MNDFYFETYITVTST